MGAVDKDLEKLNMTDIHGFQIAVVREVKRLLSEMRLKNTNGEESEINAFEQRLPIMTEEEDDISQFFPFFIVRVNTGSTANDYDGGEDSWHVDTVVEFGIFDDDKNANGHIQILSLIQKVANRFISLPLLDNAFRAEQEMNWEIMDADKDTYPFYFGGLEMKFFVPKIGRSDEFS